MSLIYHNLFTNPKYSLTNTNHHFTQPLKNLNLSLKNLTHFHILRPPSPNPNILSSLRTNPLPLKAFNSDNDVQGDGYGFSFDDFLSIAEFFCLGSSAIVSIGFAMNCAVSGTQKVVNVWLVNRVLVWQVVVLIAGVVIGSWIRKRKWGRLCREGDTGGIESVNLVGRIEKLEEDIQSWATIIRALSRQLEKLGIRFRVTRRSLKDPIAETAALSQKNSEVTQALAVQEDILERELGEIQKVLMAMQEQQQKQLELILAIAKAGKLYDNRRQPNKDEDAIELHNSPEERVMQKGLPLVQTVVRQQETNNDRA